MLKLHGSVNWKRETDRKVVQDNALDLAATCAPNLLAIATPGVSKNADVSKFLLPLWTLAEDALAKANAVVFIGYRFPPSDSYSRERLLGAIWRNTGDLGTFIVLGPNVHHEDVVRLEEMLRWTMESSPGAKTGRTSQPRVFPLFSEDYLTIWKLDPATRELRGEPGDKI